MTKTMKQPGLRLAALLCAGGISSLGVCAEAVDGAAPLERVEITGSSIRRIASENALPVQVIRRDAIERSGATSVVDLLQRLPAVQGGTGESNAVGNENFGFAGVSLHNLGEGRTLVLLNGRRLSGFGGQTLTGDAAGFDLNALPLAAIERIEVLTDGASALYGADAIGGVVNVITRRQVSTGEVVFGYSSPQGGAREKRLSVTKGYGSLDDEGQNLLLSLSHDERTPLLASQRSFARTGDLRFQLGGTSYAYRNLSYYSIPANVQAPDGSLSNPGLIQNGVCAPRSVRITNAEGDFCKYDYASDQQLYPSRQRDSLFSSFTRRLDGHDLYADVLLARTQNVAGVAAVPGDAVTAGGEPAFYRLADLGQRTDANRDDFFHLALGSRGQVAGWDYDAGLSASRSDVVSRISGFPGTRVLTGLLTSGVVDPLAGVGQQTPAGVAALQGLAYNGAWNRGTAQLSSLAAQGSTEVGELPGGPVRLGVGANLNLESFQARPSPFAQGLLADPVAGTPADASHPGDLRFGELAPVEAFRVQRRSVGAFGELLMPLQPGFDVGSALRLDRYSDFGDAATAKLSARWSPAADTLLRASVGTGFHAPTAAQASTRRQPDGVTIDGHTCSTSPALQAQADALHASCLPDGFQYAKFAAGNPALKPERSLQGSVGLRVEPSAALSLGADLWSVYIRNRFGLRPEAAVFDDPARFPRAWTTVINPVTQVTELALQADNQNLGNSLSTGLDLDVTGRTRLAGATLTSQLSTTWLIKDISQVDAGGPYRSSIADYNELGKVSFRWVGRWTNTLQVERWTHTLAMNFKSGYRDQAVEAEVLDANGVPTGTTEPVRLSVRRHITFDAQSQLALGAVGAGVKLTLGVLNLFNTAPPFSLGNRGVGQGFQAGYDDRYYDPRGRTLYANVGVAF
ncbi:MAG: TonB-dependent receptor plug domain-containing protein [Leptothrix sp. (in: b-proteobacteria)]